MAGYNYPYRSSSADNSPRTDDWSKPSYASDHVCRPVIIDAEGRKRPIVSFGPPQNSDYIVTRTETIVQEHVLSPYSSEHKHSSCRSPDSLEGYGVVEERWHRPPSPVYDCPPKVNDFITKVQTEASKPKFGPLNAETWRQTAKPTSYTGNTGGYGSEFNDYSNKEWQNPNGNGFQNDNYDDYFGRYNSNTTLTMGTGGGWAKPSPKKWDASPNSILHKPTNDISTATGYLKEPTKPSATTASRLEYTETAYPETFGSRESTPPEPTMNTHGGWARPTSATWASPPDSNISRPTSEINTAIGILKEADKPSVYTAPNSRNTEPGFTETIDSREAKKKYGNFNGQSRPFTPEDNYTTTIDSKEAARKYHGSMV